MALTEEQLEIISEAIQPLFQYLEKEVIADVARRIQKTLTYSRTAELQAMSMRELGFSPAKIRKEAMRLLNADKDYRKTVAKNTLEYKKEIKDIINESVKENLIDEKNVISVITDRMIAYTVSINGNTDKNYIKKYIENMRSNDAYRYRNMYNENIPGVDFKLTVNVPESDGGGSFTTFLKLGNDVFLNI